MLHSHGPYNRYVIIKKADPFTKFAQDAIAAFPYRELIGSPMYLMVATRLDLAFCMSKLSEFNNCP